MKARCSYDILKFGKMQIYREYEKNNKGGVNEKSTIVDINFMYLCAVIGK